MIWGVSALVFLAALCLLAGVGALLLRQELARRQARRRRLAELAPSGPSQEQALQAMLRDRSLSSVPLLHRLLMRLPRVRHLRLFLHQAGNPCNLGTLVLMCAAAAAVGALAAGWQWGAPAAAAGAVVAGGLPVVWVAWLRRRRLAAFDEQFPEAVDLIARSLRAGHSLGAALQMVAEEMEDPVAEEFARTFADYAYGKGMEDALAGLVERVGLPDLKFFVTAVILQREIGGNLTEVLDNIGHIVRERFRLLRQLKALSAEGRLSGLILTLAAPAMLGVLMLTSPGYINMLFTHPMGKFMLMAGAGFQLLGIIVIRRLVKLEV
jgi:tight adherence protein B